MNYIAYIILSVSLLISLLFEVKAPFMSAITIFLFLVFAIRAQRDEAQLKAQPLWLHGLIIAGLACLIYSLTTIWSKNASLHDTPSALFAGINVILAIMYTVFYAYTSLGPRVKNYFNKKQINNSDES